MSANGTKQTYEYGVILSAYGRIADIPRSDDCLGVESGVPEGSDIVCS